MTCLLTAPPAVLAAQWRVSVEIGAVTFGGAAMDTSREGAGGTARPYHLSTLGARLERRSGPLALGVDVRTGGADLAIDGPDILVAMKHTLRVLEVAATGSLLAARAGPASVWLTGGLLFDRWSPKGGDPRSRAGGEAGARLEWPLGGRLTASLSGTLALTGSMFLQEDLPAAYQRRAMWRRVVAGAVRYQL